MVPAVIVKYVHCESDDCPWKLKFYELGCVKQELCCGKTSKDFLYHMPETEALVIVIEAQTSGDIESSVRINFIGGG